MSDRVQVWSMCESSDFYNTGMCEWSGFYNAGMCECLFGECASGPVFTTSECARVIVWSMCKWSGCNVRMEMCE